MNAQKFYRHALEIARANLPYTEPTGDKAKAVRSALQEGHVNLGQAEFFMCIDALGGHDALIERLIAEL